VIVGYLNHYFEEVLGEPMDLRHPDFPHGPGLMFIVYTAIFTKMPLSNLWGFMFFLTMVVLGMSAQLGFMNILTDFLKALKFRYKMRTLNIEQCTVIVCGVLWASAITFTTKGGFFMIKFFDDYAFNIQLIFLNLTLTKVYVASTDFNS
jgi:SNF family Na+-dependent transporter